VGKVRVGRGVRDGVCGEVFRNVSTYVLTLNLTRAAVLQVCGTRVERCVGRPSHNKVRVVFLSPFVNDVCQFAPVAHPS
jgi:hypothetical protein